MSGQCQCPQVMRCGGGDDLITQMVPVRWVMVAWVIRGGVEVVPRQQVDRGHGRGVLGPEVGTRKKKLQSLLHHPVTLGAPTSNHHCILYPHMVSCTRYSISVLLLPLAAAANKNVPRCTNIISSSQVIPAVLRIHQWLVGWWWPHRSLRDSPTVKQISVDF